jgi:hypothetical protein
VNVPSRRTGNGFGDRDERIAFALRMPFQLDADSMPLAGLHGGRRLHRGLLLSPVVDSAEAWWLAIDDVAPAAT